RRPCDTITRVRDTQRGTPPPLEPGRRDGIPQRVAARAARQCDGVKMLVLERVRRDEVRLRRPIPGHAVLRDGMADTARVLVADEIAAAIPPTVAAALLDDDGRADLEVVPRAERSRREHSGNLPRTDPLLTTSG